MVLGISMIIIFLLKVCRKPGGDAVPTSHKNSSFSDYRVCRVVTLRDKRFCGGPYYDYLFAGYTKKTTERYLFKKLYW